MLAIQQTEFGPADVLVLAELPVPEVADGEVLVEVTLAGVNFGDLNARLTGDNHILAASLPFVPGSEVVGRRLDTGERVLGLCGLGGYSHYVAVSIDRIYPVPDDIADEDALAVFIAGTTAWHLLRTAVRLAEGESVAIHAAAGGVGSIAVQLAKSFGAARVIGTASGADRRAHVLRLGADAVIDSSEDSLGPRLREANCGEPLDVILDSTGGPGFADSLADVAPFGRVVLFATAAGSPAPVAPGRLFAGSKSISGFWLMDCFGREGLIEAALADLFEQLGSGRLRTQIGAVLPLAEAARAHAMLAKRGVSGKLLLAPSSDR